MPAPAHPEFPAVTPSDRSGDPAVVRLDVPLAPWATPAWLGASFEPAQPVDDWQRPTLSAAAHVVSLLMHLEHATEGGPTSP